MRTVFEPDGCVLFTCPQCEQWIDADAEECECGWSYVNEDDYYYDDNPEEEPYDVPEP